MTDEQQQVVQLLFFSPDRVLLPSCWSLTLSASCFSPLGQEEVSESSIDDSFRSMFAQLSGDVS